LLFHATNVAWDRDSSRVAVASAHGRF
jgi:hypothetical protein